MQAGVPRTDRKLRTEDPDKMRELDNFAAERKKMTDIHNALEAFFRAWRQDGPVEIDSLKQSGSNRQYFRLQHSGKSYIATYNPLNVPENNAFIEFSKHFHNRQIPVPEILHVNPDKTIYLQSDLGDIALFQIMQQEGFSEHVFNLFKKTLAQLARLQIEGGRNLDYGNCIATKSFDKQAIYSDLLYFLYYFVRALDLPYDKNLLMNDFDLLSSYLMQEEQKYFMHRDCQSRNVMVRGEEVFFIDYQGGMQGALQYDVASMLWQARAALPYEWRDELLSYYFERADDLLGNTLDRQNFMDSYDGFVLIRMLQTLGAYGFRGLFERKPHFIASIPYALKNLKWFIENKRFPIRLPELQKVLRAIVSDRIMERFDITRATPETPLTVHVRSFSYRKGIPEDTGGNGGGFVFDCRGILNPGRLPEFKSLTGRDKEVKEFLLHKTEMPAFMQHVCGIVDISVADYIRRGFASLSVNFGCTGGQHRSVFAADRLTEHLKEKFNVRTVTEHIEQESKNWVNIPNT
jgi:aminoglycoside/choline kinase family phosphotransferase